MPQDHANSKVNANVNANANAISNNAQIPTCSSEAAHLPKATQSLVGEKVFIKGNFTAKENVIYKGRLKGNNLALKDHELVIGEGGCIKANIFANKVVIWGEVEGDVYGQCVIVKKTGHVKGNINAAEINIETGAQIEGDIDMQSQDIFRQHAVPEIHDHDHHDEDHAKSAGFGFLFRKARELPHVDNADVPLEKNQYANINLVDELLPLSANKKNDEKNDETEASSQASNQAISVIGVTVMIEGEILSEEDMVFQGELNGLVYFEKNNLVIGPQSHLQASIFVQEAIIHGKVKGNIYALNIYIKDPGDVCGELHCQNVSTEPGAVVKVKVKMGPQDIAQQYATLVAPREGEHFSQANRGEYKSGNDIGKYASHLIKEQTDLIKREAQQAKDGSWPIFYPRS